jgi:hypothetical protein
LAFATQKELQEIKQLRSCIVFIHQGRRLNGKYIPPQFAGTEHQVVGSLKKAYGHVQFFKSATKPVDPEDVDEDEEPEDDESKDGEPIDTSDDSDEEEDVDDDLEVSPPPRQSPRGKV